MQKIQKIPIKSIDKYLQNVYDIRVCRIVRYKYVHLQAVSKMFYMWISPKLASKMNFGS